MQLCSFLIYLLSPILLVFISTFKKDTEGINNTIFSKQPWNCYDIIIILILFLSLEIVRYLLDWINIVSISQQSGYAIFAYLTFPFLIFYLIIGLKYQFPLSSLYYSSKSLKLDILLGLRVFLFLLLINYLIAFLTDQERFWDLSFQWFNSHNFFEMSLIQLFFFCFSLIVVSPMVEEVIFRGVIFGPLFRKFGLKFTLFLTSFIWVMWHRSISSLGGLLVIGIIFSYLYYKRQSLIPSTIVHFCHNAMSLILFITISLKEKQIVQIDFSIFMIYIISLSTIGSIILFLVSKRIAKIPMK